jgi:glycerol-3-phosphate dehydrogenase (NAD(P)+)
VNIDKISIIGAGSWGTALAWLWGKGGRQISLWGNNAGRVARIQKTRENADYLSGLKLPDSVNVTHELRDCANADLIVFVTPSTVLRGIAMRLQGLLVKDEVVLLSCTKGIEHGTGQRMSEILHDIFPKRKVAVLSGPNLAVEIVRGVPTATVIGCCDPECATKLQN